MLSTPAATRTTNDDAECNNRKSIINMGSSSSTPSTIFSPSFLHQFHQTPRTMEDVWKDINLSTLTHHTDTLTPTKSSFHFHDFLNGPFTFTISIDPPPPKTPPPATALSLKSNAPENSHFDPRSHNASSKVETLKNPFHTMPSLSCYNGNKRVLEPCDRSNSSAERRNKRMMKNRESAARSRARKQAYTFELQQKLKHLLEENARLKRQGQPLFQNTANQQQKKKSSLYRTFTAPF